MTDLCVSGKHICVGCCMTYQTLDRSVIAHDLVRATAEWRKNRRTFGKRLPIFPGPSGLCPSLVHNHRGINCATHPGNNDGVDMRPSGKRCYKDYICPTGRAYESWPQEEKDRFIDFLRKQATDWLSYGKAMKHGFWLEEFSRR